MTQPKLTLNLNEQNELAFKISIEGSSTDVDASKPNIRFLVREDGREAGWIYPTKQADDGFVVVSIPNSELFSEDKSYFGKLEVILGNHYFVPTEVEMEFIKPLKVEAVVVTNKSNLNEGPTSSSTNTVSIAAVQLRTQNKIEEAPKAPRRNKKHRKRSWDDLTVSEQKKLKKTLIEKKKGELRKAKLEEARRKKAVILTRRKEEATLKEQLKNLMSDSLLDD